MSEADFIAERKKAEARRGSRGATGPGPKRIERIGKERKVGPPLPFYEGAFFDQVALGLLDRIGNVSFYEKILSNLENGLGPDGHPFSVETAGGLTLDEYKKEINKKLEEMRSGKSDQIQKAKEQLQEEIEQKTASSESVVAALDEGKSYSEARREGAREVSLDQIEVTEDEVEEDIKRAWGEDVESEDVYEPSPPISETEFAPTWPSIENVPTAPIGEDEFVEHLPEIGKKSRGQKSKKEIKKEIDKLKKMMDDKINQLESLLEEDEEEE